MENLAMHDSRVANAKFSTVIFNNVFICLRRSRA